MRKLKTLMLAITLSFGVVATAKNEQKVDSVKNKMLEEVIVSATRVTDKSPVAHSNLSKKQINERNLGQDLPYLLSLTPSFITTSDAGTGIGYTGFRVRGTDANRTNITVNGIPLNDSESHGVFFVNMPDFVSSLKSIQIQRGVGTSTNGAGAFGATINMQTETINPEPYAEISTSYGSFNTNKNSIKLGTGLKKGFFADLRISNITSDGYIDRASVDMKSYFFSTGYYSDNTLIKYVTFGGKEKTYQAWYGVDIDNKDRTYNQVGEYTDKNGKTAYYDDQTDNYMQIHHQLHFSHIVNPYLSLNGALHYTRGKGYYEEYKTGRKYAEYGLIPDSTYANGMAKARKKTDLIRQKWLDNHFGGFTFAVNYTKEKYKLTVGGAGNKYFGDHYGKVLWARFPNQLDPEQEYYFNESTKVDANVFAKVNYQLFQSLNLFADLQYRYVDLQMEGKDDKYDDKAKTMRSLSSPEPFHFVNPKLGVNYQINNQNNVFASFAIANREPNRNNYTDAGENEKPTNETLYDTELGYQFRNSFMNVGANLYYMKYKNQLILTGKISEIGELLTTNIPDSYRAGLELMMGVKLYKGLSWNGNLNLSQNKIGEISEYVDSYDKDWNWQETKEIKMKDKSISYSPNVVANSVFNYNYNNFFGSFTSSYVARQYIDNTESKDRSIDPYFVNNLQLGYRWNLDKIDFIEFNVLVNNIFNEKYETNGYNWYTYYLGGERVNEKRYFPQAGTNFLCGVKVHF